MFIIRKQPFKDITFYSVKSKLNVNQHFFYNLRTFKCGHCGRTLPDSSEFHRHSALSHGDKVYYNYYLEENNGLKTGREGT